MSTRDARSKPNIVDPLWPCFYFNGNQAWGWIESREDWEWLQRMYATGWGDGGAGVISRLLAGRCLPGQSVRSANFGLYSEHCGSATLADFFADAGISPCGVSPSAERETT